MSEISASGFGRPIRFRRPRGPLNLVSTSIIAFSLTFVGVSLVALAGFFPGRLALMNGKLDIEVLLLLVPLCLLILAIVAEVLRSAPRGPHTPLTARHTAPLSGWRPGRRES